MDDQLMMRLNEMLKQRNDHADRAMEIDDEIWRQLGAIVAVMVLDMSGFTRTTREFGIIHFLAMHRQTLELSVPDIGREGGGMIKEDADNLIALFDHTAQAIQAAIRIHRNVAAYNKTVEYARQIGVCIGVSYGKVLKTDFDAFGDPVNVAYKLGEDLADPWDILVSDSAYEELVQRGEPKFEFQPREEATTGKVSLGFRRVTFPV